MINYAAILIAIIPLAQSHYAQLGPTGAAPHGVNIQIGAASHMPFSDGNTYIRPGASDRSIHVGDILTKHVQIGPHSHIPAADGNTYIRPGAAGKAVLVGDTLASKVQIGSSHIQLGLHSHIPSAGGDTYLNPGAPAKTVVIGEVWTSKIRIGSSDNHLEVLSNTTSMKALTATNIRALGDIIAPQVIAGEVRIGNTAYVNAKGLCFGGTEKCVSEAQGELQLNAPRASARAFSADTISAAETVTAGNKMCVGSTCLTAGKVCFGAACLSEDQLATLLILVTERKVQESAKKLDP